MGTKACEDCYISEPKQGLVCIKHVDERLALVTAERDAAIALAAAVQESLDIAEEVIGYEKWEVAVRQRDAALAELEAMRGLSNIAHNLKQASCIIKDAAFLAQEKGWNDGRAENITKAADDVYQLANKIAAMRAAKGGE